jgi:hypothetical protein
MLESCVCLPETYCESIEPSFASYSRTTVSVPAGYAPVPLSVTRLCPLAPLSYSTTECLPLQVYPLIDEPPTPIPGGHVTWPAEGSPLPPWTRHGQSPTLATFPAPPSPRSPPRPPALSSQPTAPVVEPDPNEAQTASLRRICGINEQLQAQVAALAHRLEIATLHIGELQSAGRAEPARRPKKKIKKKKPKPKARRSVSPAVRSASPSRRTASPKPPVGVIRTSPKPNGILRRPPPPPPPPVMASPFPHSSPDFQPPGLSAPMAQTTRFSPTHRPPVAPTSKGWTPDPNPSPYHTVPVNRQVAHSSYDPDVLAGW